jgi:hypothetical protein
VTFAAFLKGDVLEAILSEQPDGGGPNGIWSSDVFPVVPFEGAAAAYSRANRAETLVSALDCRRACVRATDGTHRRPSPRVQVRALSLDPAASRSSRVSWSSQRGQWVPNRTATPDSPNGPES